MSSRVIHNLAPNTALACVAIFALAACERGIEATPPATSTTPPAGELSWARSALERNPQIEVVASDTQSGVFTIRDRTTGAVQAVRLDELAAAPIQQLHAATASAAAAPVEQPAEAPQPASEAAPSAAEQLAATPTRTATAVETKNYTIERTDGQVRVSGPGVSIVSSGPSATASGQGEAGLRTAEPIICEGRRMVHLDSRSIYVDGDAITARGGCELYITNSRIVASGTGIIVQDAVVHVSNSHVEGANGSFDAADSAKMYVRSSTFQGVPKRTELATVQDQGGNRWR